MRIVPRVRNLDRSVKIAGKEVGQFEYIRGFEPNESHLPGYLEAKNKIEYVCELVGVTFEEYQSKRNPYLREHIMDIESWLWLKSKEGKWTTEIWS